MSKLAMGLTCVATIHVVTSISKLRHHTAAAAWRLDAVHARAAILPVASRTNEADWALWESELSAEVRLGDLS